MDIAEDNLKGGHAKSTTKLSLETHSGFWQKGELPKLVGPGAAGVRRDKARQTSLLALTSVAFSQHHEEISERKQTPLLHPTT